MECDDGLSAFDPAATIHVNSEPAIDALHQFHCTWRWVAISVDALRRGMSTAGPFREADTAERKKNSWRHEILVYRSPSPLTSRHFAALTICHELARALFRRKGQTDLQHAESAFQSV